MAEENLKVEEAVDGSAVVELPEDLAPQEDEVEAKEGGAVDNDDAGGENLDDSPDDTDAIRQAKREKRRARKEYHKKVQEEKDQRLQLLQRQNQELMERLSVVERKTQGSEIARVNEAIKDQEAKIHFARQKMAEAAENGDGDLLASAQEMWYEAKRNHEALENLRKNSVQPQHQAPIKAPDPMVQHYAAQWMSRNSWYQVNGKDLDSNVAKQIDQAMADEGWDPKSAEYWEELDNRLQRYLPHRYNEDNSDEDFRRPKRHRSAVTSTGRESYSGGKNTFTLTPAQVKAMKDAGFWDDPDKRQKMIRRYAQEAKLQRG
jgi:hypothetical protein